MKPRTRESSSTVIVTRTVLEHLAHDLEAHAPRVCFRMRYGADSRVLILG